MHKLGKLRIIALPSSHPTMANPMTGKHITSANLHNGASIRAINPTPSLDCT